MTEKNNTADLLPANWKQMSLEEKFNHVQREFVFSTYTPPGFTKATKEIWLPFLRPGKPLAQTEAEIGTAKLKPATAACHGVVQRSRKSCAATRSRANWQV